MTIIALPPGSTAQVPPLPIYRFSVDQYHRMIAAGILSEEDPVELLEGLLVIKGNSTLAPKISVLPLEAGVRPPWPPLPIRRFSVEEYRQLRRTGILGAEEPVELLEGWIVRTMPRNPPHDAVLTHLHNKLIAPLLPAGWFCRNQCAIQTDTSEPEPDLAVVRGSELDYLTRHPRPRDLALVIEVADTTLALDRAVKGPLYARAGIPFYWIVNLPERQVEVYSDPTGPDPNPSYQQRRDLGAGESLPVVVDGQEIGVVDATAILPPP